VWLAAVFWPRRYPHLTPGDFYSGLISKDKGYKTNLHTPEELSNIRREISTVSREELQSVNSSVFYRYTEFIRTGGQHFQRILLHWWVFIRLSTDHCDTFVAAFTGCYPPGILMWRNVGRSVQSLPHGQIGDGLPCKCTPFVKYWCTLAFMSP